MIRALLLLLLLSGCAHDHLPKDFRGFDVPAAYGGAV